MSTSNEWSHPTVKLHVHSHKCTAEPGVADCVDEFLLRITFVPSFHRQYAVQSINVHKPFRRVTAAKPGVTYNNLSCTLPWLCKPQSACSCGPHSSLNFFLASISLPSTTSMNRRMRPSAQAAPLISIP